MSTRKVAVITGASRGIGAGLVAGYRRRDWAVVATARTIRPSQDPGLLTVPADITDPVGPSRIVEAALERFGRLDTLVNAAGGVVSKPFTDYTAADYAAVTAVSLTGPFRLTQCVIGEMATRYGGHVVNVSAAMDAATDSGAPAVLAALTKGGLAAVTRSLALEYAARGIRVNAVFPGVIQAPLDPALGAGRPGGCPSPLGRTGQLSDVVAAVLFLQSSPYVTGEILHVDGGRAAGYGEPLG